MNDIKQYFSSPSKPVPPNAALAMKNSEHKPAMVKASRDPPISIGVADKSNAAVSSPNSSTSRKQIVSNMASVISSVEKQQKAKRKKRKQRSLAEPEISNISNILSQSLKFVSPNANNGDESKKAEFEIDMEGVELLEVVDVDGDLDQAGKNTKRPFVIDVI